MDLRFHPVKMELLYFKVQMGNKFVSHLKRTITAFMELQDLRISMRWQKYASILLNGPPLFHQDYLLVIFISVSIDSIGSDVALL